MTTQDLKFDQANKPEADDRTAGSAPLSTELGLKRLSSRRLWPVYAASAATFLWTAGIAWAAYKTGFFASGSNMPLPDLAALIAGLAAPVGVIWLMALVSQRTDPLLERRMEIARGMKKALAPIEVAEKKLETIRVNLDSQLKNIELATDVAAQRIDHLENRFSEQLSGLFSATTDADAKAASIKDSLQREREAMENLSAGLEDKISGIEESIANLKSGLGEAAGGAREQSESAADLMAGHSKAIQQNAEETLEALTRAGDTLDKYRREIEESAAASRASAEDTFTAVLDKMDEMSARMEGLENKAGDLTEKLDDQARNLARLAGQAAEDAKTFEEILERRASGLGAVAENAQSASEQAMDRLDALKTQLEEQVNDIGAAAGRNAGELQEVVRNLADQAELIGTVAGDAVRNIREAETTMDERGSGVGQLLEDTKQRLEAVEEQILKQREVLAQATQASAETLEESSLAFQARSREIGEAAGEAASALGSGSEILGQHLETLKQASSEAGSELAEMGGRLQAESEQAIGKIRLTADMFDVAATSFGREREKFLEEADVAIAKLEGGGEALRDGTERLSAVSDDAAARLTGLFGEVEKVSEATGQRIEDAAQRMQARAEDEFATLHVRFAGVLDEATRALGQAAGETAKQASEAAKRVSDETENLAGRAEMFMTRADQLEAKYAADTRDDFVRTSSLLIESLSSGAFDLTKALDTEIPDAVWRKYLEGDHSIFARRSVRIGSARIRKMIADRYEEEPEFRDHVTKFVRDFEQLMDRTNTLPGANALGVTLISSELGKLYVMLAQALKKF